MMKIVLASCAAAILLTAGTASANSAEPGNYTFDFVGTCQDCASTATAHVALHDYVLGSDINKDNFVSFSYDGTNLFKAYVITLSNVDFDIPFEIFGLHGLAGNLGGDPTTQPNHFEVVGTANTNVGVRFESGASGNWQTGLCCTILDYGTNGTWTMSEASSVPEAGPWAMLLIGFGAVGTAMRRRAVPHVLTYA